MQITQVDLENVKSYRRCSVAFTEGTNAICGPNGAGKSTLLEAIGFALFGHSPFSSQDQIVREGEKVATITVTLADEDGRTYEVVRKCGSYNQHYVYDPEIGQRLTEGVGDTTSWLCDFFGVEAGTDLRVLFRDAVGVPQGLLTAAFLEAASQRKETFNPLLRVDEYEKVWGALLAPVNRVKELIGEMKERIAGCEGQVKNLPDLQRGASALQREIQAGRERQAQLESELEAAVERKNELEEVKRHLDALELQVTRAEGEVQRLQERLAEAESAVGQAEAAREVVQETQVAHEAYERAQEKLRELEGQRQERDQLRSERQQRSADLRVGQGNEERLGAELKGIAEAEREMARLGPQAAEQERLEKALEDARREAERLAQERQALIREQERLADLQQRAAKAQAGLAEREEIESDLPSVQEEVDRLDHEYNALSTQVAASQTELRLLVAQGSTAEDLLSQANQQHSQAEAELSRLEHQLSEAQEELDVRHKVEEETRALREELEGIEGQQREWTAEAAAHQAELDQVAAQAGVLEAAETAECPVCGGPLTPEHRAELLAEYRERQTELERRLATAQAELGHATQARREGQQALGKLEERMADLARPADVEDLGSRVEVQQGRVADGRKAVMRVEDEVSSNAAGQEDLEATVGRLQREYVELGEVRQGKREALGELQDRLQALPRRDEVASLSEEAAKQAEAVEGRGQVVAALTGAPQRVEQLETEVAALGDPRRAYQRASDIADRREGVEAQRKEMRARVAELEKGIAVLEEQLRAYAGLDVQLDQERGRVASSEGAHNRYLAHIREAEALGERRESVGALGKALDEARVEHDRLSTEREELAVQYDGEQYNEVTALAERLSSEQAALRERLRLQGDQFEQDAAEIERLEGVQEDLKAARAERGELAAVQALLEYLRQTLRDAGPKITQALVEVISLQAAGIYADIMADHAAHLRWAEDYEVLLTADGRERTFRQLSGGEQMAAALAVRLALLRQVSNITVAFFDEPTANLDEARRDNLAEQIMNVKGFSQLFVISHDETFERDTDNVVRVVKENGVSRACPAEGVERVEA